MIDVSVVVPSFGRPERLAALLEHLATQTLPFDRFEVIAVDNGSGPDHAAAYAELGKEFPGNFRLLRIDVNRGPAPARNLGWREAKADLVAYTDDDVTPDPDWLEAGVAAMRADERLGVVQGAMRAPAELGDAKAPPWTVVHRIDGPTPFFEGCNLFFRRAALEETGGFDEEIGWWGEDTVAGWRVIDAGWARGFAPAARAVHPVEYRGIRWYVRNGFLERNSVAIAKRHPGFRREAFWKPWAFRRRDAAFAVAAFAGVAGLAWRPAWLGVLPYLWIGRPSRHDPQFARRCLEFFVVDAARTAGHLSGAVRHRIFVI